MAGTAKLYYIWNFFEKIVPSGFLASWRGASNYVSQNKDFISTQLHRNLDADGAYKYVNHAAFDGLTFEGFMQGKPSEEWMNRIRLMSADNVAYPGGYTEIRTNTGKPLGPWLPKDDNTIFIVTAFKVADEKDTSFHEAFEKDWLSSTGAGFILDSAPAELGVANCALFKKFTPKPGLLYVLRSELTGAGEDSQAARDFLARVRDLKYPDYFERVDASLYRPDPINIMFSPSGKRDLPEGFTYKP